MNIDKIGQILIGVKNLERAIAFYRDTLGLRFLFTAPPSLAFFDCGGIRLMLSAAEEGTTERFNSMLYYKVADLPLAYETLLAKGVVFDSKPHLIAKMPDHELWMAFFRDSERNLGGLMSEVRS